MLHFFKKFMKNKSVPEMRVFEGCPMPNARFFKSTMNFVRFWTPPLKARFEGCLRRELDFRRKRGSKNRAQNPCGPRVKFETGGGVPCKPSRPNPAYHSPSQTCPQPPRQTKPMQTKLTKHLQTYPCAAREDYVHAHGPEGTVADDGKR